MVSWARQTACGLSDFSPSSWAVSLCPLVWPSREVERSWPAYIQITLLRLRRVLLRHPFSRLDNPSAFNPFLSDSVFQVFNSFHCPLCNLGYHPIIIECQSWKVPRRGVEESQMQRVQASPCPVARMGRKPSRFPFTTPFPIPLPAGESPAHLSLKQKLIEPFWWAVRCLGIFKIVTSLIPPLTCQGASFCRQGNWLGEIK